MRIKIRGNSTFPVPYIYVDGIAIPVGAEREIEVLDRNDSPPPVVTRPKNTSGHEIMVERPNQDVIGRKTYKNILNDGRVTVKEDGGVDAAFTRQHVAAAQAEAERFARELVSARAEKAGVDAALDAKSKEHDDAQLRIMGLEDEVKAHKLAATEVSEMANAAAEKLQARIRDLEALIAKGAEDKAPAKAADKAEKGGKKADPA